MNLPLFATEPDVQLITLASGVRVLCLPLPQRQTAEVSVFVRSGSMHEPRALNGISHVVEHMVFKGTRQRDAARINLDAERLGAEVNAHTDKDHMAFHMHGLARDAGRFVQMLAELLLAPSFPEDEFERERQVLLQEMAEDEDDPMACAFRLFDTACYGLHPLAQPAIGRRAVLERLRRADLVRWTQQQVTGANLIVAAAGPLDPQRFAAEVEAVFAGLPLGQPLALVPPPWVGGLRSRRMDAGSQTHLVMGFPVPALAADDPLAELAAALFGDGMSAPLMAELRERRGLVYYAACAADLIGPAGQFVIEASFAPEQLGPVCQTLASLLAVQAGQVEPVHLERARNQMAVRLLRGLERPAQRLESAALDVYALGHVRPTAQRLARLSVVHGTALRQAFAQMASAGAAVALAGQIPRSGAALARAAFGLDA